MELSEFESFLNGLPDKFRANAPKLLDAVHSRVILPNQDARWKQITGLPFSLGSIGRFSVGRGRTIQPGDDFGVASGETFIGSTTPLLKDNTLRYEIPNYAMFFDALLRKKQGFDGGGISPEVDSYLEDVADLAAEEISEVIANA